MTGTRSVRPSDFTANLRPSGSSDRVEPKSGIVERFKGYRLVSIQTEIPQPESPELPVADGTNRLSPMFWPFFHRPADRWPFSADYVSVCDDFGRFHQQVTAIDWSGNESVGVDCRLAFVRKHCRRIAL